MQTLFAWNQESSFCSRSAFVAYRRFPRRPLPLRETIAWIEPDGSLDEIRACFQGAKAAAARSGYLLTSIPWTSDRSGRHLHQTLRARGIRGLLVAPQIPDSAWEDFDAASFAAVGIGRAAAPKICHHLVASDQVQSVMRALQNMRIMGYRRIGFVLQPEFDAGLGGRSLAAWHMEHLSPTSTNIPVLAANSLSERPAFQDWYRRHRPDAILTSDHKVIPCLASLKIPGAAPVGVAVLSRAGGPLAGIDVQSSEIGRIAFETLVLLLDRDEGERPVPPLRIHVEGRWLAGDSLPSKLAPVTPS